MGTSGMMDGRRMARPGAEVNTRSSGGYGWLSRGTQGAVAVYWQFWPS